MADEIVIKTERFDEYEPAEEEEAVQVKRLNKIKYGKGEEENFINKKLRIETDADLFENHLVEKDPMKKRLRPQSTPMTTPSKNNNISINASSNQFNGIVKKSNQTGSVQAPQQLPSPAHSRLPRERTSFAHFPARFLSNHNKPFLPGARCGEIFVANNARQWTFICTFCNKSTRDIGDFICHIKMRHLEVSEISGGTSPFDVSDMGDPYASGISGQKEDYVDCSNYLDVNVHTDPEELNYNGKVCGTESDKFKQYATKSTAARQMPTSISSYKANRKHTDDDTEEQNCGRTSYEVVLSSADEESDVEQAGPERQQQQQTISPTKSMLRVNENPSKSHEGDRGGIINRDGIYRSTSNKKNTIVNSNNDNDDGGDDQSSNCNNEIMDNTQRENDEQDNNDDGDDDDDDDGNHTNNENYNAEYDNDNHDDDGADNGDGDYDDDYDNQLLLAPAEGNSSILSVTPVCSGGRGMKAKRRQIRGPAYCSLCNKTFQYYSLYRNHMIKHTDETPFKCVLCEKGFKSKQAIRYHMHTHDREKRYKCPLCTSSYYAENQFITHVLTHENSTTFPCTVCGKIYRSDKERAAHVSTHTEERPFRCEFCNKRFRLRHHLSNHLKLHRQYRCDFCKEEFTSSVPQRKPYACNICARNPELNGHLKASASSNGSGGDNVNPLQLIEAVLPLQEPMECVDLAQMVTDSDDSDDHNNYDRRKNYYKQQQQRQRLKNKTEAVLMEDDDDDDNAELIGDNEDDDNADNDDDEIFNSESRATASNKTKKRLNCEYCTRTYSHISGLNYHLRTKHNL